MQGLYHLKYFFNLCNRSVLSLCSHYSVCAGNLLQDPPLISTPVTAQTLCIRGSRTWGPVGTSTEGQLCFFIFTYISTHLLAQGEKINLYLLLSDCASITSYSPPSSFPHAQVQHPTKLILDFQLSPPFLLLQSRFSDHSTSSFLCFFHSQPMTICFQSISNSIFFLTTSLVSKLNCIVADYTQFCTSVISDISKPLLKLSSSLIYMNPTTYWFFSLP